jgi:hypothetical protein
MAHRLQLALQLIDEAPVGAGGVARLNGLDSQPSDASSSRTFQAEAMRSVGDLRTGGRRLQPFFRPLTITQLKGAARGRPEAGYAVRPDG